MKPAAFRYHAPKTVNETVALLAEVAPDDGRVLAGGQSLVPIMAFRLARPSHLVDINGVDGPTLTLVRGRTYTFAVSTSPGLHPFHIESPGTDTNDIATGTITYTVPTDDANYFYNCTIHGDSMRGEIITVPPPSPPTVRIVGLLVDTNLVVTSTGTNNWTVNPEFSTNLSGTNWFALTVKSNRFFNGTNETICGRPPGNAVFIRIRAQQN